jgi:hypothetical protein
VLGFHVPAPASDQVGGVRASYDASTAKRTFNFKWGFERVEDGKKVSGEVYKQDFTMQSTPYVGILTYEVKGHLEVTYLGAWENHSILNEDGEETVKKK